ncbi:MAG: hypothetical protein EOP06_08295 [Proteobacteria bacterium]|nr:MAG: hypothetical protein EOP06_08295 [Pseudomonadota bacterium]
MAIKKALSEHDWAPVKAASTYREFLGSYLKVKGLSSSALARATGFTRGFPADIISGKRRMTLKSFFAFERALILPRDGKKLFKLLVAIEEPRLLSDVQAPDLQNRIQDIKNQLKPQ